MKWSLAFVVLFLSMATVAAAERYTSDMGFSATLPDNWIVLSREEVKSNADLFDDFPAKGIDPDLLQAVKQKVASGGMEAYFRTSEEFSAFADNINVIKQIQPLPSTREHLKQICSVAPDQLSQMFGRPIRMYTCEYRKVAGKKAFYMEFDGIIPETRSLQYQLPSSPNVALIITATSSEANLRPVKKEFKKIVRSITLTPSP